MDGFNFIGIGKIVIDSKVGASYNIPHLHFLLSLAKDGVIDALNIEFGIVASGSSPNEASERLALMLAEHTSLAISELGFQSLIEVAGRRASDDFWHEYRVMEFRLAEKGRDVGHAFVDAITRKAKREIEKKYGVKASSRYAMLEAA